MPQLTLATARTLTELAEEKAHALGIAVCIAVVDAGGHLFSLQRMDGAFLGSIEVAQKKAKTSILFPMSTAVFGEAVRAGQLTGMELGNGGLMCFPGGMPIKEDKKQVGAMGISGGTAAQDEEIARYALGKAGFAI